MKLERWTDRLAPLTADEDRAAERWHALGAEPDLDGMALARLQSRVVQAVRPQRRRAAGWRWQPALLALVILGVGGIAAATIGVVVQRARSSSAPGSVREQPRREPARRPVIARASVDEPATMPDPLPAIQETPPAPAPAPVPVPAETRRPRAVARVRTVSPPAPAEVAPAAEVGDGAQVRLFSSAMRAWRERDASGALERIAQYQARFPDGHFAPEAIVVKADALQALGRSKEALEFLGAIPLEDLPRSAELRLIRGELSARSGRCQEAVADLDRVLARTPGTAIGARALYARASCRARLGDDAGAEADLRLYLIRHPDGAHIESVRRALLR